jgi:2-polyprenyl-6-methoxyphenol hydroxylase-like FAD-dependent oxidoreductase
VAERLADDRCDVLVVGAGPTGLTLAAQLHAYGVSVRLIDRAPDRVHESRALAVQPRTLEVLRGLGLADELVARGNPAAQLRIHTGSRVVRAQLFDIGLDDTAFPFLLFVSQAETETVLGDHLARCGIPVERGVTFERLHDGGDGLTCTVRHADRSPQRIWARYVAGCDGAHSTVRDQAGIGFVGGSYPQTFLLADLEVDGLEAGTVNAFLTDRGPLLFFPLGHPAPWRLITMRPPGSRDGDGRAHVSTAPVSLAELQELTERAGAGRVRLGNPVWSTAFRLHHRHAARYRAGRVFLAGDAAHIHSPAGAQGMNTGIQDAVNLGWKLGMVIRGASPAELLDSYDAERRPVGEFVLRFTDRAFTAATSTHPVVRAVRTHLVPRLVPVVLRFRAGRAAAFRTVSQLGIGYRRSPAVEPGPRFTVRRPRSGDRLPDAQVVSAGEQRWLHEALGAPAFHLLLVGPAEGWDDHALAALGERHGAGLVVHRLDRRGGRDVLSDPSGAVLDLLHVRGSAHFVVRPDGHVGYRADHRDLTGAQRYLSRWHPGRS